MQRILWQGHSGIGRVAGKTLIRTLTKKALPAQAFGERQFDRFGGRPPFTSPLARLGRLVVLGLIIWFGCKLVTGMTGKQGWQLAMTFNTKDAGEPAADEKVESKKAKK